MRINRRARVSEIVTNNPKFRIQGGRTKEVGTNVRFDQAYRQVSILNGLKLFSWATAGY